VQDLEAAIAVASGQPETIPGKVILHGFSMGASIALLTLPHPDVLAVIADSPYAHIEGILMSFVQWQLMEISRGWSAPWRPLRATIPALSWATVAISRIVFRVRYGHQLSARPASSLRRWHARANELADRRIPPILLIHGTRDTAVPISHAHEIAAQANAQGIPLETFFSEGSAHCGTYGDDPQGYVDRLQDFVARYLGDDFPRAMPE
jgi:dienelactone hydrolase